MDLMLGEAVQEALQEYTGESEAELLCAFQQGVLDIARQLVVELGTHSDCEIEERKSKLEQLKSVLEM